MEESDYSKMADAICRLLSKKYKYNPDGEKPYFRIMDRKELGQSNAKNSSVRTISNLISEIESESEHEIIIFMLVDPLFQLGRAVLSYYILDPVSQYVFGADCFMKFIGNQASADSVVAFIEIAYSLTKKDDGSYDAEYCDPTDIMRKNRLERLLYLTGIDDSWVRISKKEDMLEYFDRL